MEHDNQPFLLNNVRDISGIEKVILLLAKNPSGITEDNFFDSFVDGSSKALKEKIEFLKILNVIEKIKDNIKLTKEFNSKINIVNINLHRSQKASSYTAIKRHKLNKIKQLLLLELAKISFILKTDNTYEFRKQAAILLIYSFLATLPNGNYITSNQQTVNEIKTYFKNVDYVAMGKRGKEIELNINKLGNALKIMEYFGLVKVIKNKKSQIIYQFFDPYMLMSIINDIFSSRINKTKIKVEEGIPIVTLLQEISSKYIPMVKKSNKLSHHIDNSLGSALWILYSREQIVMKNYGDIQIISDKPQFLTAKFTDKVNWITKVHSNETA